MTAPLNQPTDQHPIIIDTEVIESSTNENDAKGMVPAWLISIGTHTAIVAAMAALIYTVAPEEVELPPMRAPSQTETKPEPEKTTKFTNEKVDVHIDLKEQTDSTQPVTLVEITDVETTAEADLPDKRSPGDTQAVADVHTGSTGVFMSIGAGSQSAYVQ